ncbi:MAG: reverse gyrase [Thermanaeromonas sp.]|uniref:reverse gyrase n=1 Tax=Thermanaeromonas sp. TaxID=2003697 RepID=UPI00243B98FC|nr:reverse gyrase [Thermanaeromonas sp.]MCG0277312.1 reverse gyrase [Thermanaeromonas sp.]
MSLELFLLARGCPNCGGSVTDERLAAGLPCANCLPQEGKGLSQATLCGDLRRKDKLQGLSPFCRAEERLENFAEFFQRATGLSLSPLQRLWAKRFFLDESFAIIAPPGVGKTTLGLVLCLYNEKKSLILSPTRLLVWQIVDRLARLSGRAGYPRKILGFTGKAKEKKELMEGNYDVLVVTTQFFYRHWRELAVHPITFVFIDDVDALLKNSRQIDSLFHFLGYSAEEVDKALRSPEENLKQMRKKPERLLILSSATLKPRNKRVRLFQRLMGFSIQRAVSTQRRVLDCYEEVNDFASALARCAELIEKLGAGGLVLVSAKEGREGVREATMYLKARGIRAESYLELAPQDLVARLLEGSIKVAVGLAHPTNPLVRGLDLPQVLKYVIFVGVPAHLLPLELSPSPGALHGLLLALFPFFTTDEQRTILRELRYLRPYLSLPAEEVSRYPALDKRIQALLPLLEAKFKEPSFWEKVKAAEDISVYQEEGRLYLALGDAATYLQASGRVSRLTASGLTRGLAITLCTERRMLGSLKKRLRAFSPGEIEFIPLQKVELEEIMHGIEEDRRRVRDKELAVKGGPHTALVVVESPHKARTIASFWGKPGIRRVKGAVAYEIPAGDRYLIITSCLGHVFNLSRQQGFFGVLTDGQRFLPVFDTIKISRETGEEFVDPEEANRYPEGTVWDKQEVLQGLQHLAFEADEVFVASDPDAEGEKIAYDLYLSLRPFNPRIFRLEFHEITPAAFCKALETPGQINLHRVQAQLTRRVLDRWVGFCLSRRLWQEFGNPHLSAGRVQTPVLGWVIACMEKRREKKARITFSLGCANLILEVPDLKLGQKIFAELDQVTWEILETSEEERPPLPPFTTDTILTEAFHRLRLSAPVTMKLLQELFESGYITYHRTDSTRVSETGRFLVAKPFIVQQFGEKLFHPRSWGKEGAHEAIRPTRPLTEDELRWMVGAGLVNLSQEKAIDLYGLIFRRFIASQMAPARVRKARVRFRVPSYTWETELVCDELAPGFALMWPSFSVSRLDAKARLTHKAYQEIPVVELYTEGTLIQEMKRQGIGRPSTYAEIIATLLNRRYLAVRRGSLYPTRLGFKVYRYLRKNFPEYTDTALTREIERTMDLIAEGKEDYQEVLRKLYKVREILP